MQRTFLVAMLLLGTAASAQARTLDATTTWSGRMVIRVPRPCFNRR